MAVYSDELQLHSQQAFEELKKFTTSKEFMALLHEMYELPPVLRHDFVLAAFLDDEVLRSRGIDRPDHIIIQRSEFADKRPTLFCVTRKLPPGLGWKKVTITFDNRMDDRFVPVDSSILDT